MDRRVMGRGVVMRAGSWLVLVLLAAPSAVASAAQYEQQPSSQSALPPWAIAAGVLGVGCVVAAVILSRRRTAVETPAAPKDTTAPPGEPESFGDGRYVVKRFLGEGGMKQVYLAHDTVLDRDVAFSLIRTDATDASTLERMRREAQSMARLGDHANIVQVFDVGQERGRPCIIAQYLDGGSIQELIWEQGPLAIRTAAAIARDVAAALEHAHAQGVVHRDVKPANIWLTKAGSAKLGDFGLAVALDRSRMTTESSLLGTVAYMSPEQARGEPAESRSDLYALGLVLYEMLTGKPPFSGDGAAAVLYQHVHAQPDAPSKARPDVPHVLDDLVVRLLEKDPDERPASATDVGRELGALLATLPAQTAPPAVRAGSIAAVEKSVAQRAMDFSVHAASDGTVTLMFVDIESSTPLAERIEDRRWLSVLHAYRDLVTRHTHAFTGKIVDTVGDGFLIAFSSARAGLHCAVDIQRELSREGLSGQPVRVRIGLHSGDAIRDASRFVGQHVHRAARVAAAAKGGEILASSLTRDLASGESFRFGSAREINLRGFSLRQAVVAVLWQDEASPKAAQPPPAWKPPAKRRDADVPVPVVPKRTRVSPVVWALVAVGVVGVGLGAYGLTRRQEPPVAVYGEPSATGAATAGGGTTGTIAFQSDREGKRWIFLMSPDGSHVRRLTASANELLWPSWRGGDFVYTRAGPEGNALYIISADGGPERLVANNAADADWSSTGRIVYTARDGGPGQIRVVDADGSDNRALTSPPDDGNSPSWSPDGKRIVFTSSSTGNDEVWVMDADGSGRRALTAHPETDGNPAWSPDGKRIAFVSKRDGNLEIYVMDADGRNAGRLTTHAGYDSNPAWSPDSSRIAFTSDRDGDLEIYVMKADGSDPRRLTFNQARDEYPHWY